MVQEIRDDDWIDEMKKLFDFEEMERERQVKLVVTTLQGHACLWWDGVQAERRKSCKKLIKKWNMMVSKLREKFLHSEYHVTLYRETLGKGL